MNITRIINRFSKTLHKLAVIGALILLQACTDDENVSTTADGIYTQGTGTIDGNDINDLKAIVHNGRLMMFNPLLNVLYDGNIIESEDGGFSSQVDVYRYGKKSSASATIEGIINNRAKITGTISGEGVGNATFTLLFNDAYDRPTSLDFITNPVWTGQVMTNANTIGPGDRAELEFFTSNTLLAKIGGNEINHACVSENATFIEHTERNVYQLSMDIVDNLDCHLPGTNYTGFATIVDSSLISIKTNDLLIVVMSNGVNSIFGLLGNGYVTADINQSAPELQLDQVINWDSYNIDASETVDYIQSSASGLSLSRIQNSPTNEVE